MNIQPRFHRSLDNVFNIRRKVKYLIFMLLLMFSGLVSAVPATFVTLVIENDPDSNGNISMINGSKVKVSWEVISNADKLLHKDDRIQLVRVDGDEDGDKVVYSVKRGKGKSGTAVLKVKNSEGEQLYVRYRLKINGEAINTASHPDSFDNTPLWSISKANLADITIRLNAEETKGVYAIGDVGPAGGWVFYADPTGRHGMEAAPSDVASAIWGCKGNTTPGAGGIGIRTGEHNSMHILEACATEGIAARLADEYENNGYTDWYLPSKGQLEQMYMVRNELATTFTSSGSNYISSSEIDAAGAWFLQFNTGFQSLGNKAGLHGIRPVRSF